MGPPWPCLEAQTARRWVDGHTCPTVPSNRIGLTRCSVAIKAQSFSNHNNELECCVLCRGLTDSCLDRQTQDRLGSDVRARRLLCEKRCRSLHPLSGKGLLSQAPVSYKCPRRVRLCDDQQKEPLSAAPKIKWCWASAGSLLQRACCSTYDVLASVFCTFELLGSGSLSAPCGS